MTVYSSQAMERVCREYDAMLARVERAERALKRIMEIPPSRVNVGAAYEIARAALAASGPDTPEDA